MRRPVVAAERVPMSSDARFPPSRRLRQPHEFQHCFTQGQRVNGRYFRLHAVPSIEARLGLAVSRKVDTSAVVRNRIKRIARDSFRRYREHGAFDCALVARREAATATPEALRADLDSLWRRAAALKPIPPAGTMRDASGSPMASRET